MSSSKFSGPFMQKSALTPLQGNAFIKAKMDAEAAGKSSFSVDGKNYPLKMETPLEMHESDKYKETYNKWLSYGDKGGEKTDNEYRKLEKMAAHVNPTGEKLPRPKKEKSVLEKDKKSIVEKSPIPNIDPEKKKAYQDSIQKLHKPAYNKYVRRSQEGFEISDDDGQTMTQVAPRKPEDIKSLKDFAYNMEIAKGGSVTKDGVPASKLARMYK